MKITRTNPEFENYRFFVGEKEYLQENVCEASEEDGWIMFYPDKRYNPTWIKKDYGKVYIVRFRGFFDSDSNVTEQLPLPGTID